MLLRAVPVPPPGSCVTDAPLLFPGGSLCGLLCAPLHAAQVRSGADMYPCHGCWFCFLCLEVSLTVDMICEELLAIRLEGVYHSLKDTKGTLS